MKRCYLTGLLVFIMSSASFSQSLHFGVMAGTDVKRISGNIFKDKFTFGYHLGGFAQLGLSKTFAVQPEVYFSQNSFDTADDFHVLVDSAIRVKNLKMGYLNIPLLLNIKISELITLQGGPQFGILIDQSQNLTSNGKNAFKTGDFSLVAGIQVSAASFLIYGRYIAGISDASNIDISQVADKSTWKSQTLHLGVGLRF